MPQRMKRHPTVALATCSILPDLDEDESLVIPALAVHDVLAVPAVWDDASVDWHEFELVVVRSTWDYAERREEFLSWIASLRRVLNSLPVLDWNTNKIYLRDLAAAGIPVVSTTWIEPGAELRPDSIPRGELVVKPAVSAGARNTSRYRGEHEREARAHIDRLLGDGRTVMVQPYLRSVDHAGETGLIYFGGLFSHAVNKGPLLREAGHATTGLWEPERITARDPHPDERDLAENVLDALSWPRDELLYARVDVVRDPAGLPMVLELELAEPSLFLACAEQAAERFAKAIAGRLNGA
jgi:glutathione synthase/RimK-type ligase-like ATP-grasp enzyme